MARLQLNPDMLPAAWIAPITGDEVGGPERAKQVYDNIRNMGRGEKIDFQFEKITRTPTPKPIGSSTGRATKAGTVMHSWGCSPPISSKASICRTTGNSRRSTVAGWTVEDTLAYLESDAGIQDVAAETRFAYENGISGVPCFIVDRRYAVAGAQEPEAFFPLFDLGKEELEKLAATGA